jgi:hypothetical protein
VSWRDVIPATRAESLDRHPGGFHPQGRPQCHLGGGPGLGLSPTGRRPPRKGSIGICGAWSSEGRAKAKRVHGGGDSPPGSRRPSRPLPASREGRWPPKRHSHGGHGLSVAARSGLLDQPQPSPGWETGRGARGSPRDGHRRNRGEAPRPLARGVGAAAKGARGPSGRGISGPQGCPYPEGPTLIPPPTGGGFRRYGRPPSRRCAFVQG